MQVSLYLVNVDFVAKIGKGKRVEDEPVVIAATNLLHTNGEGTIADDHLYRLVPVTALEEAVRGAVEGIAGHAVAGDVDSALRYGVAVEVFLSNAAVKNGHEGTADIVEEECGADDLLACFTLGTNLCLCAVAIESLEFELVGAVGQSGDGLGERELGLLPALYGAVGMSDAVATLGINTVAFLYHIPPVALVLISEVMASDEPCGVLRIGLRGGLQVF